MKTLQTAYIHWASAEYVGKYLGSTISCLARCRWRVFETTAKKSASAHRTYAVVCFSLAASRDTNGPILIPSRVQTVLVIASERKALDSNKNQWGKTHFLGNRPCSGHSDTDKRMRKVGRFCLGVVHRTERRKWARTNHFCTGIETFIHLGVTVKPGNNTSCAFIQTYALCLPQNLHSVDFRRLSAWALLTDTVKIPYILHMSIDFLFWHKLNILVLCYVGLHKYSIAALLCFLNKYERNCQMQKES